jgi:hypothetical protein
MRKTMVLMLSVIVSMMLLTGVSYALDVCVWHDCPQPGQMKGIGDIPDIQIFKNINLNGETDYIKMDDGWKPAGGLGTNLITIKNVIDIDGKIIKTVNSESHYLGGIGAALSVPDLFDLIGITRPAFMKEFVTLKLGPQITTDVSDGWKLRYGVYATIFQTAF